MSDAGGAGSVVVIGAGINGLVAANYLQRHGLRVTLLERRPNVGGACTFATIRHRGRTITYAPGASVLGMMQDFVFEETGLAQDVEVRKPQCPEITYFHDDDAPFFMHESNRAIAREASRRWNEHGRIGAFRRDLERVASFLRKGYRAGRAPTLSEVNKTLGREQTALWITGTARRLLDHYFTSDRMKIFFAMSVTESGPVSLDTPSSAFTIPLMTSGSVFDGSWGYVKGGIWQISRALERINARLGVRIITAARVTAVSAARGTVRYRKGGRTHQIAADRIVFATDPLSAAKLLHDRALVARVAKLKMQGSSGKLVMIFDRPVRWKHDNGHPDFHCALRYIVLNSTLEGFERSSQAARQGADFAPGFLEIYCEGPAMERFDARSRFHAISVFFKDLGFGPLARDLPQVRKQITALVLDKIENRDDLIRTVFLTPKDIANRFYFPMGNIDHVELNVAQTFFDRTYSPVPKQSFYQFGDNPNIFYCGAGSYPCGSVAGTPGYMCATQILRQAHRAARNRAYRGLRA